MCFSCGSLFKSDAPECRRFDRFNVRQRKRCKSDEACLYYTWKLSDTKRGLFHETTSQTTSMTVLSPCRRCVPRVLL